MVLNSFQSDEGILRNRKVIHHLDLHPKYYNCKKIFYHLIFQRICIGCVPGVTLLSMTRQPSRWMERDTTLHVYTVIHAISHWRTMRNATPEWDYSTANLTITSQ